MEKHYSLSSAAELLGVTTQTLRNWDNSGKINVIRTPGNQRRIPESEIVRLCSKTSGVATEKDRKPQRSTIENDEKSNIIMKNNENHILMCKDNAVYDITESKILDEKLLPGCMLKGNTDFRQWMETRYSRDTNFSSQRLMQRAFGKIDNEHAAYITGALSLSDCYWIKQQNDDLMFQDITPYINEEWNGIDPGGIHNDYIWGSLSNLFVSGKSDKRWLDSEYLLKVNSFKEIEAFKLCSALDIKNIPETKLANEGIIIRNFTSSDIFYESMEQFGIDEDSEDPIVFMIKKYQEQAVAMLVLDYLTENTDRRTDDYGFLRDSYTGEYISMAPYYNFDWIWSGDVIAIPDTAWQNHRDYIYYLSEKAIQASKDFEYGTIIERRAEELLKL